MAMFFLKKKKTPFFFFYGSVGLTNMPIQRLLFQSNSSMIVALMQAQSTRPVKTFTIGFDEAGFDEAPRAAAVARQLGTDHTEIRVTSEETRAVIPNLPTIYDEPFGDSSQIPTS